MSKEFVKNIDCYECSVYGLMCQQETRDKRILMTTDYDREITEVTSSILDCGISNELWEVQSLNLLQLLSSIKSPDELWNKKAKKAVYELKGVVKSIQAEQDRIRRSNAFAFLLTTVTTLTAEFNALFKNEEWSEYPSESYDYDGMMTAEESVRAVKTVVQQPYFSTVFDMAQPIYISEANDSNDQLGIDMQVPFSKEAKFFLLDDNLSVQVKSRPDDVLSFLRDISHKHSRNKQYVNPCDRALVVCCGQYGYNELAAQIGIQLWANSEVRNPRHVSSFLNILDPQLVLLMQRALSRTEMEYEMIHVLTNFYHVANQLGPRRLRKQSKRKTNDPKKKAETLIDRINQSNVGLQTMPAGNSSRFAVTLQ